MVLLAGVAKGSGSLTRLLLQLLHLMALVAFVPL